MADQPPFGKYEFTVMAISSFLSKALWPGAVVLGVLYAPESLELIAGKTTVFDFKFEAAVTVTMTGLAATTTVRNRQLARRIKRLESERDGRHLPPGPSGGPDGNR